MEPRPEPPPWLPVTRTPSPPAPSAGAAGGAGARPAGGAAAPSGGGASPPPATPRPTFTWQRLTRTRRGAAGLAIGSAALLLWPFAGWAAIPWLVGLGVLVLLRLLRLDGLLRGWVWHLGGLVVVAGLMYSTGPWAWALAASIGVLVAGLLQLPWWRLAAVGVVMCAVSGVGFAFSTYQTQEAQRAQDAAENAQSYSLQGERTPERVVGALLENIAQDDVPAFCGLLDVPARSEVVRATGAADCPGALAALRSRTSNPQYQHLDAPTVQNGSVWLTDACRTAWATPALGGQALGRIEVRKSAPPGGTYFISRFLPC
jgi:hypothetical protein